MGIKLSNRLGLQSPFFQSGPLPDHDHCGYEVACQMLLYSLNEGRNDKTHLQWDTFRQLRTSFSNFSRASNQANLNNVAINDNRGSYQRIGNDSCGSFWFVRFRSGCKNRMGQNTKQNKAFSTDLILAIIEEANSRIKAADSIEEQLRWMAFTCYSAISYVISLRGNEGFLLDLDGLNRHNSESLKDHFIIALLGKMKGEANGEAHLIPCINETSSGIPIRKLVFRLIKKKRKLGFVDGPAISDVNGKLFHSRDINDMLISILVHLFKRSPDLFPVEIILKVSKSNDIEETLSGSYACFRSFRRASDSRALEKRKDLEQDDVEVVNRWRAVELARGKRPNLPMKQHYADVQVLLLPFLRYTKAM